MKLGVVIPTYHRIELLGVALASLKEQTRHLDEVVVVCADPTEHADVESLVNSVKGAWRTRVVSGPTLLRGGGARNLGWRSATADIIFFLDDDDHFAVDKVRAHLEEHEASGADVVYSAVLSVFRQAVVVERPRPAPGRMTAGLLEDGVCPPTTSCVSVKRSALEHVGGFDEQLSSYQDWDLWFRMALREVSFSYLDQPLTFFVHHDGVRTSMDAAPRKKAASVLAERYREFPLGRFFRADINYIRERRALQLAWAGDATSLAELASYLITEGWRHPLRSLKTTIKIVLALSRSTPSRKIDQRH